MRRAVWGMSYADDPGNVSKFAEGLGKMITIIVAVFEAVGHVVMERKGDHAAMTAELDIQKTARRRSSRLPGV